MSSDPANGLELSADSYPGPFCGYRLEAGEAVIQGTNEAFVDAFSADSGDHLETIFDGHEVEDGPLLEQLLGGGRFTLRGGTQRYRVQAVPPVDENGQLVFIELSGVKGKLEVGRVASVIAHDLRNPLDVAKARLEAGRELSEDEHFEHVARAHDRMGQIIQDVLTLSRGEELVELDEHVSIEEVTRTAWNNVTTERGTLHVARDLPITVADPDRVGRLLENLFRNSIEHGPDNGENQLVTVTVGPLDDGFYVADDGSGIPMDKRNRVFAPGYTRDESGTGLGLATVSRIADVHGWSISVTESASGGARFEIRGLADTVEDT